MVLLPKAAQVNLSADFLIGNRFQVTARIITAEILFSMTGDV